MAVFLQDLDQRFPIVDENGKPTDYFLRLLRGQTGDLADAVDTVEEALDLKADKSITLTAGTGLDGGGDLSANRTFDLADTAVTSGTYGDATNVPQITIDDQGRITDAVDVPISGGGGGGSDWTLLNQDGSAVAAATVTITIASPGVVSFTAHGFVANQQVAFSTTGALPTGLTAGTTYFVRNPAANTFEVSATSGGASINTSGSQSGVHSVRKLDSWTWSTNVTSVNFTNLDYDDVLFFGRGLTASASLIRILRASTNNGSSFFSASGDYISWGTNGLTNNDSNIGFHDTANAAARTLYVYINGLKTVGPASTVVNTSATRMAFVADLFNPVNALQLLLNGAGNITGGTVALFGR